MRIAVSTANKPHGNLETGGSLCAVVDIGTNSIRMAIAEINAEGGGTLCQRAKNLAPIARGAISAGLRAGKDGRPIPTRDVSASSR